MRQRMEKVLVQELIADFAVKALGKTVLTGFAWCDVMPFDAVILRPLQNDPACEFGAVVADNARWLAPGKNQGIEFAHDPDATDRRICDQRQAFPATLIHNSKDPEPPSIRQPIAQKIE